MELLKSQVPAGEAAPAPPIPQSEADLLSRWQGALSPVVSVFCATFNHAPFIRDALNGILAQETDFPFEVLVRDDASTDGTSAIVSEYARQFPHVIRPILEVTNTYSKGVSPLLAMSRLARGEFVAHCEGDDYWIDRRKLATQVSMLRKNADAAMCFHDIVTIRDGMITRSLELPAGLPTVIAPSQYCLPTRWFPMPVTWLYRRAACDFGAPENDKIVNQDSFLLSQLARFGPAVLLPTQWSVYRLHGSSTYSSLSERQRRLVRINSYLWISRYHFRTGHASFGRRFARAAAEHAEIELDTFGRPVARWSVLALLLAFLFPKRRLRRILQVPSTLFQRIKARLFRQTIAMTDRGGRG